MAGFVTIIIRSMPPSETTFEELLRENAELKSELEKLRRRTGSAEDDDSSRMIGDLQRQLTTFRITEHQLRLIGSVVETSDDGILILTPAVEESGPRVAYANTAFSRITGITQHDALAQPLSILRLSESDRPIMKELLERIFADESFSGESLARRNDGSEYTAEVRAVPVRDASGITHWILFMRDVSARREQMLRLERQAQFDALTELPNRLLLFDRLEQAVLLQKRSGRAVALMIMDLDRFKEVNDGFGHQYGDLLLKQVAFRLKNVVRQSDTVARLGGDEFAIILPQVSSPAAAMEVAQKIQRTCDSPFIVTDKSFDVGASIGIALCPDHGEDGATLLRRADIAMYRAKQSGSEVCLYSADQDVDSAGRYELISSLRHGIENNELLLHYQPKIDLKTRAVVGAEALVRWQHPREGLWYPDKFIHVAETSGLIKPMTTWILNDAIRRVRHWLDDGLELQVAVNLSPVVLRDSTVPETVSEILDQWDVEPAMLRVEITESSILADPEQAMGALSLLKTLGCSIAIDDFGTGYSSLANLRQIPFDEIKIDKSFVMGMRGNESDAAIVRATIDLCHALGRVAIAEGVEDEETLNKLSEWKCDLAQGYFISRPITPDALLQWLHQHEQAANVE